MKRAILTFAALALVAGLGAATARASDDDSSSFGTIAPRADWMSISDLARKIEAQGHTIHEIEIEHGVFEVKMTDHDGMRVKTYLHPVTGEPVKHESWDD